MCPHDGRRQWAGTMNLTEPHCGTDLGLMRTKSGGSRPGSDYKSPAPRLFISGGEQDLPRTSSCTSCWRASKRTRRHQGRVAVRGAEDGHQPRWDGRCAERRVVRARSSTRWASTAIRPVVLNFDNAVGWLVGEENKGMTAMFVSDERGATRRVGVQGLAQSEVAYRNVVAYAKDRLQGRTLTGPQARDKPCRPHYRAHPGCAATLMSIRAFNEAARARGVDLAQK